jgi:hypothetical protein
MARDFCREGAMERHCGTCCVLGVEDIQAESRDLFSADDMANKMSYYARLIKAGVKYSESRYTFYPGTGYAR